MGGKADVTDEYQIEAKDGLQAFRSLAIVERECRNFEPVLLCPAAAYGITAKPVEICRMKE
jgi:hypothetical protein